MGAIANDLAGDFVVNSLASQGVDAASLRRRSDYERIAARWDALLEGLTGIAALRELVLDNLPLGRARAGDQVPHELLEPRDPRRGRNSASGPPGSTADRPPDCAGR